MPLGLPITNLGGIGGPYGLGDTGASVVIDDHYWEIHSTAGAGYLTPILLADVIPAIHDTWQLITLSGVNPAGGPGHYQPRTVATVSDEGYWDVHTISSGNDAIKPLDV